MQNLSDRTCRLIVLRKLDEASKHFEELFQEDRDSVFGPLPLNEIEGFLRFSERELVWAFGLRDSFELDPFIYDHIHDLTSLDVLYQTTADLHFVCGTLAVLLSQEMQRAGFEQTAKRDELQASLHRETGITAPPTFSDEEIAEMVADIQNQTDASIPPLFGRKLAS